MMLRKLFMLLFVMLAVSAMPAFAQDTAGQETTQEAAEQDATQTLNQGVTRFRIINLSPDAPALTTFINGQPSGLQDLAFPSMTGWIEIPAADLTLSFSESGGTAEQPLVDPVTITGGEGNWMSIVLVGSAQTGTLAAYRLDQALAPIPDGCAWVTVFHGMEGGPAVDAMLDTGAVLGPSILYPSDSAQAGAEATAQAGLGEQALVPSCNESTVAGSMAAAPVQCVPLTQPMTRGAEATAEAAEAAVPATSASVTCAFSFLTPAGLYNLQFAEGGGGAPMLSLPETQLDADTYYFLGLTGTAASPQFFAFPVPEAALVGMLGGAQAGAPPAEATPEAGSQG